MTRTYTSTEGREYPLAECWQFEDAWAHAERMAQRYDEPVVVWPEWWLDEAGHITKGWNATTATGARVMGVAERETDLFWRYPAHEAVA